MDGSFSELQRRFDEIISELPAYGGTLAKIKSLYESIMTKIEDCNRVRSVIKLQGIQHSLKGATLRNFHHCEKEYQSKLIVINEKNDRLREMIKTHREQQETAELLLLKEKEESYRKARMDSGRRRKLNLTIEEATDISLLDRELKRVNQELEDIKLTTNKRHVPLSKKVTLQIQLQDKEKEKMKLNKDNMYLGCLLLQLSASLKCAVSVYNTLQQYGTSHEHTVTDLILTAISNIDNNEIQKVIEDLDEEDRDGEKEAEFVLYCTEKFHELFDSEQYEEAALLAATSPMGSLRNIDSLNKFKSVSQAPPVTTDPYITPLLQYCTTLMHSARLFQQLSDNEAMEFVLCALDCRQYERLLNWVANGNLPVTKEMATLIFQRCTCQHKQCICHCCEIAMIMFEGLGLYIETAMCLAKLGLYNKLNTFIRRKNLQRNDVLSLLYSHPIKEFALSLLLCPPSPICDILEVVFILCQSKQFIVCETVLKEYIDHCQTVTISDIFNNANRNPAYTELIQSLLKLLVDTPLQWMVLDIVSSRVVVTAMDMALSEIQHIYADSNHSMYSQTKTVSVERDIKDMSDQSTPSFRQSQHRLVRSSNIDLHDTSDHSSTTSVDSTTSSSYTQQTTTQNSSDDDYY